MGLGQFRDDKSSSRNTKTFRLFNIEDTEEYGRPIVHLFARDETGKEFHIEVDGHVPSFFIHQSDYTDRTENHPSVQYVETGYSDMYGEPLARVYTYKPDDVKSVKGAYGRTWEADVWFTNRFLIDKGIYTGFEIDMNHVRDAKDGDYRINTQYVEPAESPEVDPRCITVDIEVARDDGFPHPEKAEWPVVTIVAHDSYTDQYTSWMFAADSWAGMQPLVENKLDDIDDLADSRVFDSEKAMLNDFNWWLSDKRPDLLSGWYSDSFDYPYLINRCDNLGMFSQRDWSPLGQVYISRGWGDPRAAGVSFLDMLDGYDKLTRHKLKSKKLEDIAQKELGKGKVKMPLSFAEMWRQRPVELIEYNIRDVEAVVQIDDSKGILPTFSNLRDVTGVPFASTRNNINMIDILILREAQAAGIRLPSAEKPEEDWYHGAYVFTPVAGLHEDVVYPDLASLYPNMMYQCNMSPETIVGTKADLFMSEYTEADCVWSYIDPRPVKRVQKGEPYKEYQNGDYKAIMRKGKRGWKTVWSDDPKYVKLYYLSKDVQEGFVSSVVGKLLNMKMEYKGTDLYDAVKAVVNSVYGVFGDSNSFGTGFRLFDWRLAESITLGGRKVIQYSADKFASWLNDYQHASALEGPEASVVAGDTDSVMTAIPFAKDAQHASTLAEQAATHVNQSYNAFCLETFGTTEHAMEIEVESYSPRCLFIQDKKKPKGVGVKKRYVTEVTVEDGETLDEPKFNIKGFEAIRSDVAQVTIDAQKYVFEQLMHEDLETAKQNIVGYISDLYDDARNGEIPLEDLGIPFGIGQKLHNYGSEKRAPTPQYRGAKYANEYIYGEAVIKEGDKPLYFYVSDVGGELPQRYTADTNEDGREVDAISVVDAEDMPDAVTIDVDTMLEKTVKKPIKPITDTLGWDWDELQYDTNLARFM